MKIAEHIPDVNYHLTNKCNMSYRFCFAHFDSSKELDQDDALSIVRSVAEYGFKKINFVGGEPTLCPWLGNLFAEAKKFGLTSSIVTNGWNIDDYWLEKNSHNLDWIGFSIDSLIQGTNQKLGRCVKTLDPPDLSTYLNSLKLAKKRGLKIKINTVVTQLNKNELLHELILEIRPEKWKIFQVLIVKGENENAQSLVISKEEFERFLANHHDLDGTTVIYPEYNDDMSGSYLMIDPSGRFVDNTDGVYRYSDCILDVGVEEALNQVAISTETFKRRHDTTRMKSIVTRLNEGRGGELDG